MKLALNKQINKMQESYRQINDLRQLKQAVFSWMLQILQGKIPFTTIENDLKHKIESDQLLKLYKYVFKKPQFVQRKAFAVMFYLYGIGLPMIAQFLFVSKKAIKRYIQKYEMQGVDALLDRNNETLKISEDLELREQLLSIIHCPPNQYGINRTSWTISLVKDILTQKGYLVGKNTISAIIRKAGYRFWKAKEILTSTDPNYKEKVNAIIRILSKLRPNDRFFR